MTIRVPHRATNGSHVLTTCLQTSRLATLRKNGDSCVSIQPLSVSHVPTILTSLFLRCFLFLCAKGLLLVLGLLCVALQQFVIATPVGLQMSSVQGGQIGSTDGAQPQTTRFYVDVSGMCPYRAFHLIAQFLSNFMAARSYFIRGIDSLCFVIFRHFSCLSSYDIQILIRKYRCSIR